MKSNQYNKTFGAKTGKALVDLINSKQSELTGTEVLRHTDEILFFIWENLLGHSNFDEKDDFFKVGGNSLKAVQLVSRISKQFSVDIQLTDIFLHPSIALLAGLIRMHPTSNSSMLALSPRPERIPLSFSQERFWFIDRLEGSVQYHLPAVLRLKGKLDKEALEYTLQSIVNRHEILRTVIREEDGKTWQYIKDKNKWKLNTIDSSRFEDHKSLQQFIEQLIREPFDLSKDDMLRASLITMKENEYILVLTIHHIASDGWSTSIIVKEVSELYEAFVEKRTDNLPALEIQYADYAIWQKNYLQGELLKNKISYWKEKLQGVAALQLPSDFPRPAVQSSKGAVAEFNIDKELSDQLRTLSQQKGSTLFMTLLAAFNVLLYRYSGQQDICVGTPIAGRQQQELEGLIGFFVNTLAIRSNVSGNSSFSDLLQQIKTTTLEAYEHQEVPFEKVVDAVVRERDKSRSPLFQVLFTLQNTMEVPELRLGEVQLTRENYDHTTTQFDLGLSITDTPYGLKASMEYCTDLYTGETINRMMGHYRELLSSIVKGPQQKIETFSILTKDEQRQLLQEFNDTNEDYSNLSVIDIFEQQVAKTPDNVALVFEDEKLTYLQLNQQANQLAHYLQNRGVKAESLVPICVNKSMEMIIGILAILKAGGAYVPIDPSYPEERISYMLEDTKAEVILSRRENKSKLQAIEEFRIIELDSALPQINKQSKENPPSAAEPNQLAYLIYTSGSTGKPKGVMIEHRNLVNYLLNNKTKYVQEEGIGSGSFIHLSYTFDASVTAIFMPLLLGRSIVIGSQQSLEIFEDDNLWKYAPYDFIKATPSHLGMLQSAFRDSNGRLLTKKLVVGGEALLHNHFDYLIEMGLNVEIINEYGPTEATVGCSIFSFQTSRAPEKIKNGISIGKPIGNAQIYILNEVQGLLPVGVPGEIYIGGNGLSRGYLNRDELTVEKFISNPFSKSPISRLYRTGDIGRWLSDGNIEYIGRLDNQVKIRGYRVELGEIENVLQQSQQVRQVAVLAKEDTNGSKSLVAYIVPMEKFNRDIIISYAKNILPDYMVPALWVELERLPLTSNGKIDKKALPDPDANHLGCLDFIAPRTELEQKLAMIWQDLLEIDQVGINDDFFEIGGHSLLAIRLISAIRKQLDVEIPINDVFEHSTIAKLALYFADQIKGSTMPAFQLQPRPERIPLSFSQEQLWIIDRIEGTVHYHLPAILRLRGNLNREALVYSFQTIVNRHEVLRTVFIEEDGRAFQKIKDKDQWKLSFIDGSEYKENINALENFIQQLINEPFDLSKDDMLRASLITLNDQEHLLVVTMHHIASDGWSVVIIVKEIGELYTSYEQKRQAQLALLPIQYADYAIWQRHYLQGNIFDKKLQYWEEKLTGVAPLQLPVDYLRPAIQSTRGDSCRFKINKELTGHLKLLSKQYGATLFMTCIAAFKVLLHRYSSQNDICVGTPVAGRQQQEVESLIGFFINTLALRSDLSNNPSFIDLLQAVKVTSMDAYSHQEVPFEKIVDAVVNERDISRSPIFQVTFVFQNTPEIPKLNLAEVKFSAETFNQNTSKFDLTFSITETDEGLDGIVVYAAALYNKETITRMIGHFTSLLTSVVNQPWQKIAALPMLNHEEESQLLIQFNDTEVQYPKDRTIVDLFEEQAERNPHKTAIVFEQEQLTYKELSERSSQLAYYLRSKGVKEEILVPIFLERSLDMIVGILAILKAGGAYVPVDPDYPAERIKYILEDTKSLVVVSNLAGKLKLQTERALTIVAVDEDWPAITAQPFISLQTVVQPHNLAYVLYTSGSTGKPKGVMIEHSALLDHCYGLIKSAGLQKCSSFALFSPLVFDAGHAIIYASFLLGGSLHVLSDRLLRDGQQLDTYINKHKIDCIKIVPSLWLTYADGDNLILSKEVMIFGGEGFSISILDRLKKSNYSGDVYNHYGPTEATIGKCIHKVDLKKVYTNVPIGKPFSNTQLYILDHNYQLVPISVAGELYIAGDGLARGYLNMPELTDDKFIANPFSTNQTGKMYKTGDQVRWLPDGNIEYMGRVDEQVKIRGHRIEIGEIESELQQSGLVHQAVVVANFESNGNGRLISYVVPNESFDKKAMLSYLRSRLPEYMVPALWVEIDNLPLTPNGKIDKKSLPVPEITDLVKSEFVAPRNEMEDKLAVIWQELLDLERVGIHDNFFELGGDSIITIQVVSRARRSGYILQPKDLFVHQTISKLSGAISARSGAEILGEQNQLTGLSGLLPIQQGFFEREVINISHFNQSVLLCIDKSILEAELKVVIEYLTDHHDALRFKYYQADGRWQQEYGPVQGKLMTEDLQSVLQSSLVSLINEHADKHHCSLDIEKGEVIRVVWMQTPPSEVQNRLLIIIHHLAVDGVSWRILLEDMDLLLSGLKNGQETVFDLKRDSYRQWYNALEVYGQSRDLLSQKNYWQAVVKSYRPFSWDKNYSGKIAVKDTGHQNVRLEFEQTRRLLQEVPRVYHSEINDILLSALSRTLCEWSNRDHVIIGLEGHGREDVAEGIDISRTVGWFTSLYPVKLEAGVGREESDLIKTVKEQLREVKHKGLGFGVLKYINKEEFLQGIEPWDIKFNYLGQLDNVVRESKWFKIAGESAGNGISEEQSVNEKLSLNCFVQDGELIFNWRYSKLHLHEETVKELATKCLANLELLIAHCIQQQRLNGVVYTPSDFGLTSEITIQELDSFLEERLSNDKVRKDCIDGLYRLSSLQQGMLFHGLYDTKAGIYLDQFGCDLINVDLEFFKLSWDYVLKGHSILRSAIYYDTFSIPVQCAYTNVKLPIEILDYRGLSDAEQSVALKEYEEADHAKGFDFKVPPLMRLSLIRLTDDCCRMLWTWHHILMDGWSKSLLMEEFLNAYELLASGMVLPLREPDHYEDFIRYIERTDNEKEEKYWRNYMKGLEQSTLLPFIRKTSEKTKDVGESKALFLQLDETITSKIQSYAQQHHVTVNTIMQGVWACLLHRYTGNNNIVFGVIVSGRPEDLPYVEKRIGMYINTMPWHTGIKKEMGIVEWLKEIQQEQVSSRQYQHTSVKNIQSWTEVEGDLFDSLLVFQNYPFSKVISSHPWKLRVENIFKNEQNNLPLTITVSILGQISIEFRYDKGLLYEESIREIIGHFEEALHQLINNPQGRIGDIDLLTQKEQHELLITFNSSQVTYPNKSIVDLFEEQVIKTPDNVAVVFENEQLSYQQLNERSNQLALYLKSKGVKKETLVPIFIERGLDMMVGILAILKMGGAYVPVDTDFPLDRIKYMLEDTDSSILLSSHESRSKLALEKVIEIIEIDGDWSSIKKFSTANLQLEVAPHDLAYVIYTSGSTGKPKGVMIEHKSLVDYYYGLNKYTQIDQCRSFALVSTIATDLGNTVIYASLLSGGALHIFSKEAVSDTELLHGNFRKHGIDCLKIVPSHWKALCIKDRLLLPSKLLVFGGEALQARLVEDIRLSGTSCRVINHYGPTETTIGKLLHIVEPNRIYDHTIPIGKPFSNTRAYVLSQDLKLCPVGVPGQLYIHGDGVARGYFNYSELTREKFIHDPFSKHNESRMYGTGDLVKYLADGNIEYIGRVDDQVKIRGYRIELGEIENVLLQGEMVSHAVVVAREDKQGNKRLIAYVVPDSWFDREEIVEYLKGKLPAYMIPAIIMELKNLPLTANGKVDRKALPDPDAAEGLGDQYVAPRNEVEAKLAEIWQDVLDTERVGIHDNFFELGGDSIISIQVVSRARRSGYEFQVADVFTYQTIASLVEYMENKSETMVDVSGEQLLLTGSVGLLPVQQWYFEKQPVQVSHFNQSVLLTIDKAVTEAILRVALEQLTMHHDALRFRYQQTEGVWQQEYGSSLGGLITVDLLSSSHDSFGSLLNEQADGIQRSLNIEKGELIKIVLVMTPEYELHNRLLIVIHHLAVDGVSWRVLLEDLELLLTKLKNGEPIDLGKKSSSYRQWFDALERYGQSLALLSQTEYWEHAVKSYQPLPVDKEFDGIVKQKDKGLQVVRLGAVQTRKLLQDVPRVYHTEINDILLCALVKTMSEWSNQDKVVIGLEGHGREVIAEGIDTTRTVGWFTIHYPLLLEVASAKTEEDLIKSVKEQLRQVPNKGVGYGVLKYINKQEAFKGTQPWDIVFNYLGQLDNVVRKSKWLAVAGESGGADTSEEYSVSEKLWVNCSVREEELVFNWTYSIRHFNEETVQRLATDYLSNLESLIYHCIEKQASGECEYTPSDFGLGSEMSYKELDIFLNEPFNGKPRKESIEALYRLSGLQEGMLFHGLYDSRGEGYINHFLCDLINPDLEALNISWNYLVKCHSILRSAFYHDSFGLSVQCVYRELRLPIEILDYSNMSEEEQNTAIKQLEDSDRAVGFDFKAGLLMRISLIRLNNQRYRMLWSFHHILFDGWSRSIMMSGFLKIYDLIVSGKPLPPVVEDRYEDYIRYIEKIDKDKERSYWKNYLKSVEQSTLLPFIGATTVRNKGLGLYRSVALHINKGITGQIERFTQRHRITMNTLMQGVWSYLLHRYTGSNDISYGITVSGRPANLSNVEQRVGLYINTLLLYSAFHQDDVVVNWLQGIQDDQVLSRNYEHTPLHIIQGWTGVQGDLFDSYITFENYPVSKLLSSKQWSLEVENVQVNEQNNFPLTLIINNEEQIDIEFNYNSELLKEEYVKNICNHFEQVLLQMTENGEGRLNDIKLLSKAEKQQLLTDFNNTSAEYPKNKTTIELFEEQVRRSPRAIALVFEDEQLTYKELDDRSNQLAHHLIAKGIKPGSNIGLLSLRCIDMITGMFGILKTGCAYVPFNIDYPAERLNYIIEDAEITHIVYTDRELVHSRGLEEHSCTDVKDSLSGSTQPTAINTGMDSCAYIMYTSGTTGKPKGIAVSHRNIIKLAFENVEIAVGKEDRVLQWSNYSFDGSVYDIYSSLLKGAGLYLIKDSSASDVYELARLIKQEKITVCFITTALFNTFIDVEPRSLKGLRKILFGGEMVSLSHVRKALAVLGPGKIIHVYGPTETTVYATYYCIDALREDGIIPIGKPLSNTKLLVLNIEKDLVPVGVTGELYIGGDGVALGYVNNDTLSEEKFIKDPFSADAGGRLYKTGDMVRWLGDGNIEFFGRLDQQVKIRGYRIELGEIESVLQQCNLVRQAVVMAREDKEGTKSLVGYIVPDEEFDRDAITAYLQEKLPAYMVPSLWVELEQLPLTTNGKINKNALPDPDATEGLNSEHVGPRNEIEQILTNMWQELLDLEQIGVHDNFFELGGHSLLAVRLISSVRRELKIDLPVSVFFELPTIEELANYIKVTQNNSPVKMENYDTIKL